ncbi:MAG: 5'-deoxynucleotidase [Acutalibacteraceae bacterium]|nr:5'-deoxynucleotidase [Acutalibacteraceae bacterium]
MKSNFFAVISRMKYINRWGLMRSTHNENLSEHCLDVALFAHAIVSIDKNCFGGTLSPERAAMLALYHDASEIITGDMPTPVKYYNEQIRNAYQAAEDAAKEKLISYLPSQIKEDIAPLIDIKGEDEKYLPFIKAADKMSAYVKCIEERTMGNTEFADAEKSTLKAIKNLKIPAVDEFLNLFIDAYSQTLDRQQ